MLVTVVMTTFNRLNYVSASIASVLNQTHRDLELIIVDDHSTDGTFEVVESFARRDKRVRPVRNPENRGVATCRNNGLSLANSELIVCHDDDDIMLPERIEKQVQYLHDNPQLSVVSSWAILIDHAGRVVGHSAPKVDMLKGRSRRDPTMLVEIITSASMYRKKDVMQVGGFRFAHGLDDRDLWGRMITEGFQIGVQPEYLVEHRKHGNSIMVKDLDRLFEYGDYIDHNIVRRMRGQGDISIEQYRDWQRSMSSLGRLWSTRRRRSQMAFRCAVLSYGNKQWTALARCLLEAMLLAPYPTLRRIWDKW
ncbi:glycosyltransferase family 2 protein [Methylobacterium sp. P31]